MRNIKGHDIPPLPPPSQCPLPTLPIYLPHLIHPTSLPSTMHPLLHLLTFLPLASTLCLTTPGNGCSGPFNMFCCPDDKHLIKPTTRPQLRSPSPSYKPSTTKTYPPRINPTPNRICAMEPYKSHKHPELQCCGWEYVAGPISCYGVDGEWMLGMRE